MLSIDFKFCRTEKWIQIKDFYLILYFRYTRNCLLTGSQRPSSLWLILVKPVVKMLPSLVKMALMGLMPSCGASLSYRDRNRHQRDVSNTVRQAEGHNLPWECKRLRNIRNSANLRSWESWRWSLCQVHVCGRDQGVSWQWNVLVFFS